MKKKLKVEKAFRGKIIRRPGIGGRPINVNPNLINPVGPRQIQQPGGLPRDPNMYSTLPSKPGPIFLPRPDGTLQNMHPAAGGIRPGGMGPLPNNLGPMQGVGDPRLGAATIPGNQAQMQMRGPTQAAPVQPVPAMKKGGAVRGVRIALRGAKKATIY